MERKQNYEFTFPQADIWDKNFVLVDQLNYKYFQGTAAHELVNISSRRSLKSSNVKLGGQQLDGKTPQWTN